MNKKALYGLLLAVLLPLIGYFLLKRSTDGAVVMPRHYIPDSVMATTVNGKESVDTAWHTIPDFTFTNQLGNQVSLHDLDDRIIVANFFFTHCPTICPPMTRKMKALQDGIKSNEMVGTREANFIHFLSFSIDPERDSVRALKKWADRFQVNPQNWWLLTGDRQKIYDLSIKDMKLLAQYGGPTDSNFLHTDLFVLIDKNKKIRGYYHALDSMALSRLSEDIVLLALEKDKNKKSFLSGKLELLAVVFAIAAVAVILLVIILKKENKKL
ncbi:MAG TPA: SCO family protein [Flavisolibacter sp.]|jgi:protein SCO1/2|nr:SCO family protein [Flavisolibacter sp.]